MSVLIVIGIIGIVYKIISNFENKAEFIFPQQYEGKIVDYTQTINIPENLKVKHFAGSGTHIYLYLENEKGQEEVWVVEHVKGKLLRKFAIERSK